MEELLGMYQLFAERRTVMLWPLECNCSRIIFMFIQWLPSTGTTRMLLLLHGGGLRSRKQSTVTNRGMERPDISCFFQKFDLRSKSYASQDIFWMQAAVKLRVSVMSPPPPMNNLLVVVATVSTRGSEQRISDSLDSSELFMVSDSLPRQLSNSVSPLRRNLR